VNDVVIVFDAAGRRNYFFFDTFGEIVGKVAVVFETVISTSPYAVVVEALSTKWKKV
jgi:hypothetical protein